MPDQNSNSKIPGSLYLATDLLEILMPTTFVQILMTKFFNSDLPLASVANMKKNAVYCVELSFIIIQYAEPEESFILV